MTPKRIVEKITAFALSGMIALSSIAVGSITNTNKISAARTDTEKTEASPTALWKDKSLADIKKLYNSFDTHNVNSAIDLDDALSDIKNDKTKEKLHLIYINSAITLTKGYSIPSNTYIRVCKTLTFTKSSDNKEQGRFSITGSKNVCIDGSNSANSNKITVNGERNYTENKKTVKGANAIYVTNYNKKDSKGNTTSTITSNNIVLKKIDFSTSSVAPNSTFVSINNSSTNVFCKSLLFTGNVNNAMSVNTVTNLSLNNITAKNLTASNSVLSLNNVKGTSGSNPSILEGIKLNNINSLYGLNIIKSQYVKLTSNSSISFNKNATTSTMPMSIRIVDSNNVTVEDTTVNGNGKANGIVIGGSTDSSNNSTMTVFSKINVLNSTVTNCLGKSVYAYGAIKNIQIKGTEVSNTVASNEQFGILIRPKYTQTKDKYGVLEDEDYIAKILDCNTAATCNSSDPATCEKHIHNNGTGVCISSIDLDDNFMSNEFKKVRSSNPRNILIQNVSICCDKDTSGDPKYNIRSANNSYFTGKKDSNNNDIYIPKININLKDTKAQLSSIPSENYGIYREVAQDSISYSEFIEPAGAGVYRGRTTGLKYSISNGTASVVGFFKDENLNNSNRYSDRTFIFPSRVKYIDTDSTKNIDCPVTTISDNAFNTDYGECVLYPKQGWNKILGNGRIIIPNSIYNIGLRAFQETKGIKSIFICNNNVNIGEFAFYNCYDLGEIEVSKAKRTSKSDKTLSTTYNEKYMSKDGVLYEIGSNDVEDSTIEKLKLVSYPASHYNRSNFKVYINTHRDLNNFNLSLFNDYIKNRLVYLYDNDTEECYFPEVQKFQSISGGTNLVFKDIPSYANNLTFYIGNISGYVYNEKNNMGRINGNNKCDSLTLSYSNNKATFTYGNSSLIEKHVANYSIPSGSDYDFSYTTRFSNFAKTRKFNITSFEYRSFVNCAYLTSLTLNKHLEEFKYMKNGQDSTASVGPFEYKNSSKPTTVVEPKLKTIAVADGNEYFKVVGNTMLKTTALYSNDFSKFYLLPPASGAKDFTLNSNVKSIANYAFAYNPTLESVTCDGTKLYEIGIRAFYECNNFKNFNWTKVPEYKGYDNITHDFLPNNFNTLPSFLDYSLINHIDKKGDYVPNVFGIGKADYYDALKLKLGYSKMLLSDNLKVNGISNIFKSAVQRMYNPLYYGVLENVEEKALAISNNNLNKSFQDFMNGSITDFTNNGNAFDSRWSDEEKKNATKSGTDNYDSTDTKKANNVSILNKSAKWTNKDMTNAEVNIDYSYGENKNKYNFLFVLDKTGSMNEANSASRSKMYDQYSTVYNMSKAILSDKKADNKVGIINFSDEKYTDMMNGSDGSTQELNVNSKGIYSFGNLADNNGKNMLTNNLEYIDKYLSDTETYGGTYYDVGMKSAQTVLSAITSDTSRKTAVIFISDGAPASNHSGKDEANDLRKAYSNVPIYTILEFVADTDTANKYKSAMGEISGVKYPIDDLNNTTKINAYNTYNKFGKDSNELTNAFKSIYENFTSTPKQVLQDTISQAFTTDSITLTRTIPQYDKINLAVDVNDTTKGGADLYGRINSNSINEKELQLVAVNSNNNKVTLTPYKKLVAQNHIRYVFSNVPNEKDMTYYLTTSFGDIRPVLEKATTTKFLSAGLLKLDYGVGSDTTSYKLMSARTLLATNSGSIIKDKAGNYLVTKQSFDIPVPLNNTRNYYYYYLKKDNDNVTLAEISDNPTDFTEYYKNSLDGIVIKLYKDNKSQVHIRVFINDAQCLVKYSLNFGLTLNKNSINKYGTYFYTNDGGNNTECFVVNNNEETLTPTDGFSNYTNTSTTTKIINKVPSPRLLRQKYGDIVVKVMKENFGLDSSDKTYKYFMETNSQVKDLTAVTLLTKGKDVNDSSTQLIFGSKDSYTYKDQPLYDSDGKLYSFTVKQSSSYDRFNPVDSVSINSTTLLNNGTITATLNNYLKKGPLEIKKSAFDKIIKDVYFKISNNNGYNEIVYTNSEGKASPVVKKTSRGSTNYLPVYNKNNILIKYSVTELGNKSGNSYSIPIKYKPEKTTVGNIVLTNYKLVTVNFDNLSRNDFTTEIKNVDKNYYGETKDNGKEFECVDITNGVPENKKPVSTNTKGKVYENQIGSFDVTFKNKVADTKSALCEILIDGKSVYSQKLSFNNNGEKTVRVIYDYKWNIDPRKVIARINYNNRNDEVVTNDNVATTTLQPKEWLDFSVKIDGLYTDSKCTNKLPVNKANGKYYYANKGQQFYIKATFTNKNKGRAYNPPIDVLYGDDIYLEHYFLAENIPANGSQTGVIEVTADTDLCVKDLAVRINWTGRGSEANPNDNEDKVTVEVRKVLDLSIEPIKPNVSYYNDYDVVTSVMVYNKTTTEAVLPDDHVKVTFKAFVGEQAGIGVLCYQEQKEVVIPACKKGEPFASNLVYFKWHVPKEKKTSYIYWIATINEDKKLFEADYSDNTTNISEGRPSLEKKNDDGTPYIITSLDCLVPREDYVAKNTPSTKYEETSEDGYVEKDIGKSFDYITPRDAGLNNYNNQAIWSEWSFDSTNNKFIKHTYGQTIGKFNTSDFTTASLKSTAKLSKNSSHSETIITPDKNSPTVERDDNGNWTMRSGYGFSLKYNPKISSFYAENGVYNSNFDSLTEEEKADKLSNATTGIQMASAYYPEFMYMDKKFTDDNGNTQYTCNTLERNVLSTNLFNFNLPMNDQSASILTNHKEDSRIHFIPIWYKNGDYNISIVASYSWTPAGAISTCDNSTNINIDGSMYDDWYLTGDAH